MERSGDAKHCHSTQDKLYIIGCHSSFFPSILQKKKKQPEFLVIGLPEQLEKLDHPTIHLPLDVILAPVDSARDLGVDIDGNLTFHQHIFLLCL